MKTEQLITFLISPEQTIVEAMQKIDANAKGILFITNTDRKLIGAITDGDIRRWLIKTGNLQEQISRLMNRNPKSVYRREVASAQDVMRRYSITALPVLNSKGIVIDILFEQEQKTEVREGSLSLAYGRRERNQIISLYQDFAQTADPDWGYSDYGTDY